MSKETLRETAQYFLLISFIMMGMAICGYSGIDRSIGAVLGCVAGFFATRHYARFLLGPDASGIETEGHDREDGHVAKHESPTAESRDAQKEQS